MGIVVKHNVSLRYDDLINLQLPHGKFVDLESVDTGSLDREPLDNQTADCKSPDCHRTDGQGTDRECPDRDRARRLCSNGDGSV
jgi:hypothetical protein